MKTVAFIASFLFAIACTNDSQNNDKEFELNLDNNLKAKNVDSLNNSTDFSYLNHLPLRKVATLILQDSVRPTDNDITFKCMDSVLNEQKSVRDFYFLVFLKIMDKSDGALSEAVCGYAKSYSERYTVEFANRCKQLSQSQIQKWADFVGFELSYDYESKKSAMIWQDSLVMLCRDCDSIQKKLVKDFASKAIASMELESE